MSTRSKLLVTATTFGGFLLGVLATALLTQWNQLSSTFWDIKLFDVVNLLVVLFVAIILSYMVNQRLSQSQNRRKILADLVGVFQENLREVYDLGYAHMLNPQPANHVEIKKRLRVVQTDFAIIEDVLAEKELEVEVSMRQEFWDFKKYLTDDPFMSANEVYTHANRQALAKSYQALHRRSIKLRLKLA